MAQRPLPADTPPRRVSRRLPRRTLTPHTSCPLPLGEQSAAVAASTTAAVNRVTVKRVPANAGGGRSHRLRAGRRCRVGPAAGPDRRPAAADPAHAAANPALKLATLLSSFTVQVQHHPTGHPRP